MVRKNSRRCPECGRLLVTLPCVACNAERFKMLSIARERIDSDYLANLEALNRLWRIDNPGVAPPECTTKHDKSRVKSSWVCQHAFIKRHGKDARGKQRYRCSDCGKCFSGDEWNRPLPKIRTRREVIAKISTMILAGRSARYCSRKLKIKADTVTSIIFATAKFCETINCNGNLSESAVNTIARKLKQSTSRSKSQRYLDAVLTILVADELIRSSRKQTLIDFIFERKRNHGPAKLD